MVTPTSSTRRIWFLPLAALAAVVYPPLLLTAPGQVVADTKTYLYLEPGRLLSRAVSMWDPHVGLGTVPHQQIGYLWPAGPYYWVAERIGFPDWVAQRVWLGTILVAAGAGVLYLGRTWRWRPTAAAAAAFLYALSPFVLTLAARISVLLLPFAGLPWLLALTVRSTHTRGWRYPAVFALVVATVGSVNATSVALIGIVPGLWVLHAVLGARTVGRARGVNTLVKLGVTSLAVNLWWIGGLSVQATNGIDILRYTETAEVVADASVAPEVLRGLGYWFFYGGDRLGPWIEPSVAYTQRLGLIALTYALPALGLLSLGIVRWRHRTFLVSLAVIGTVVAVGAHPWDSPSGLGSLVKAFLSTDIGLAMRSLPRAVPLVALAVALGTGSLVGALAEQVDRRGRFGAVLVASLAVAALPPLWTLDLAPENLRRDEQIPDYWEQAATHLDDRDDGTRVLEIPGTDFASYRWGNTVDPITPGLIDRPYVARELIPLGSPASADLVKAVDLRLQEGTMPAQGLAAIARILGVGDIVLRNDLQYERYNTPRPRTLLDLVRSMPDLAEPVTFGDDVENRAGPEAPLIDEAHLARDASLPDSPAVAVFAVEDAVPIVRAAPAERLVLLAGDGAGLVDAATAGLLRGDEVVQYSAERSAEDDFARSGLVDERAIVITDTNRRQAERWTTIRHTEGFVEQADGGILHTDRTDNRLPVLAGGPDTQTVAEHRDLSVRATGYGNPITYTPEERPANATDGDVTTAWRVAAFEDAVGERIVLQADEAVELDRITLLQPQTGAINRWITEVAVRFDGGNRFVVELDESSRSLPGQVLTFPARRAAELSVEILADTAGRRPGYDGLTSVGFAEIGFGGVTTDEVLRMPTDLLDAGGYRTHRYPLALVQTRLRTVATDTTRTDTEFAMARAASLPTARDYAVTGDVRLSARAGTETLDSLLREPGTGSVTASSTLPGGLRHLPANVLDGDARTVWTSAFADLVGQRLTIRGPEPTAVDQVTLVVVDDPEHSVPTAVQILADGLPVADQLLRLEPAGEGLLQSTIALPASTVATTVEVVVGAVEERTTIDWDSGRPTALPISVAEVTVADWQAGPQRDVIDTDCRADLVRLDGRAVPVRVTGDVDEALEGRTLALTGCDPVAIAGGDHTFRTSEGRRTGLDIDQLVWRSAAGGTPSAGGPILPVPGPSSTAASPTAVVTGGDAATVEVDLVDLTVDEAFWLILGQSHNPGWALEGDGIEAEGPFLVNGYANGWLVRSENAATTATMRFVPQNRVEVALLLSVFGLVAVLGLALLPAREVRPLPVPLIEPVRRIRALTYEGALPTRRDARIVGLTTGLVVAAVVTPPIGVAVGVLAGLVSRRETWRPLVTLIPAVLLAFVAAYVIIFQFRNEIGPGLHWPNDTGRLHPLGLTAVLLLAVDAVIERLWAARSDF